MKFTSRRFTLRFLGLLIAWLSPLLLGGGASYAQTCTFVPFTSPGYQYTWTYGTSNIAVPPRAPNGTVLASGIFEYGYSCQSNPAGGWRFEFRSTYIPTDIPGVYKPRNVTTFLGTFGFRYTNADTGQVMMSGVQDWMPPITGTAPVQGVLRVKIDLVKVSDAIYDYPNFPTGLTDHAFYIEIHNGYSGARALVWSFTWRQPGKFVPMPQSCTVLTPSVRVPLKPISASKLNAIGATAGDENFNIGLSCRAGSNVHVTLTDLVNNGNLTDQLTLTTNSTAKGVKLRILRNGNPVRYGPDSAGSGNTNQWYVGPSATTTSIPLSAQYIATGQVSAGTVIGVATFTMSYQ